MKVLHRHQNDCDADKLRLHQVLDGNQWEMLPRFRAVFSGIVQTLSTSFPRDLAILQLLLSGAWIILSLVMRGRTTVFPHRGLASHQFTGALHWGDAGRLKHKTPPTERSHHE